MNERIRILAEQRGLTGPNYLIASWELEKFAKLLVLECCNEIVKEPFNAGGASDWLKEQFGVKE